MIRTNLSASSAVLSVLLLACTGQVRDTGNGHPSAGSAANAGNGVGASTSSPPSSGRGGSSSVPGGANGNGSSGAPGANNGNGSGGSSADIDTGGAPDKPAMPFEAVAAASSVRKVKNLLTGLAPTDAEVQLVASSGPAGLQQLISTWMSDSQFQPLFREKMVTFFRNAFQQTGFVPTEDFKHQLLENGGFDFGPFGTGAVGDDAFFKLVQNLEDSFALTAWQIIAENRPFTEVLTTQRFMMTTALKSLYVQIEMPNDQPYASFGRQAAATVSWKLDLSGTAIPLADTLNSNSPNYLVFDDQAPVNAGTGFGGGGFNTCQGTAGLVNPYTGYADLFQRLVGFSQRYPFAASPQCWEHASRPYFTADDLKDWTWVTIGPKTSGDSYPQPFDLPTLRAMKELKLVLPRIGFFTTPAYLALWNTNDSNQHRVTANQTLLVALGQSFTGDNQIAPVSTSGLDDKHSVTGTECYGCHKGLDPLRQFWGTQLDYNDRNDFPKSGNFMGGAANPRPSAVGGALAFGDVNANGASIADLANLLLQVHDSSDPTEPITRFALAFTQKLCFFANSAPCQEGDPEFRRVAKAFEQNKFNFPSLLRDLFSSPLVTAAQETQSFSQGGMPVSITRRDQFCQALSNRLGRSDICAALVPLPTAAQKNTLNVAGNIPADAFGRGSENPVTPTDPTLFFRAASEMLCEDIATQVVDATSNTVYSSSDVAAGIEDMVTRIMSYPPSDPHHVSAVQILTDHYNTAKGTAGSNATNALRSTFAAACQSPSSVSIGL